VKCTVVHYKRTCIFSMNHFLGGRCETETIFVFLVSFTIKIVAFDRNLS
jgi:hypothetical protein